MKKIFMKILRLIIGIKGFLLDNFKRERTINIVREKEKRKENERIEGIEEIIKGKIKKKEEE